MYFEAILASAVVALASMVGVFFFGDSKKLQGVERYVIPTAVGVFLSLVFFELIPETLAANQLFGGLAVAVGFIGFYILSYKLHSYYHCIDEENCGRRGAAMMVLIGDGIHNIADGVILGAAFLVDPAVGVAVAIGLALHEIPQEIVEFGVLVRGGYSRMEALLRNLLSASSIVIGTVLTLVLAEHAEEYIWIITGVAAGNLLYLAATELLPRVHGNLKNYSSFWLTTIAMSVGFVVMTAVLVWTHETFGHGHDHDHGAHEEELHQDHDHDHELHEDHHDDDHGHTH